MVDFGKSEKVISINEKVDKNFFKLLSLKKFFLE